MEILEKIAMIALQELLHRHSHRQLELTARAHNIPFTRRVPKAVGREQLAVALQNGAFKKAFRRLTSDHLDALRALQVAGGWMPLYRFTDHFGQIPAYKPWRRSLEYLLRRHPWRYPVSVAERLFHLGFVHIEGQDVLLVSEAADWLPPLPVPPPSNSPRCARGELVSLHEVGGRKGGLDALCDPLPESLSAAQFPPSNSPRCARGEQVSLHEVGGRKGGENLPYEARKGGEDLPYEAHKGGSDSRLFLLRDLSALLGTLMQIQAQPIYGRWLSLEALRAINVRLIQPENLDDVRSELQSGRLRWLHYLAQVAGLVAVQGDVFTPTMSAWRWLNLPPDHQWDQLMQAVERDLESRQRLWDVFRFPSISLITWQVVRHQVDSLSSAHSYRVRDLFPLLKPYLLPDSRYAIACLLRQMLTWSGVISLHRGRFAVHPHQFGLAAETVEIRYERKRILVALPLSPSAAFTSLLSFAEIDGEWAILHQEAIREAVRQGIDSAAVVGWLETLSGQVVPASAQTNIREWFQSAQAIQLQPAVILYAQDPADITRIRDDWRLAKHIIQRLSPNHLLVKSEEAEQFLSRLQRREYGVTSFIHPQKSRQISNTLTPGMVEYLLLAVRTYQQLQSRLHAGIRIPKALAHWLSAQVEDSASIEREAESLTAAVQKRIPQQHPIADNSLQDEATMRRLLHMAWQQRIPITIDYHSPYLDDTSTRTLHIHEIYDSNDLTYIDAFCELVGDQRTFRVDRILRVHESIAHEQAI